MHCIKQSLASSTLCSVSCMLLARLVTRWSANGGSNIMSERQHTCEHTTNVRPALNYFVQGKSLSLVYRNCPSKFEGDL